MTRVTTSKLKMDTDEILERVRDSGEQFEVWRNGQMVARILPADIPGSRGGQGKGQESLPAEPRSHSADERAQVDAMEAKGEELRRQTPAERAARLARLDALSERIGARWPDGVSAIDAVRDIRRDL